MPRVVHFDIPADDPARAADFYREVFGWKIEKWEGPVEYWMVTTGEEGEPGINGGLTRRQGPDDSVANTVEVSSVDEYAASVQARGGKVIMPKSPIPGVGYLALCKDTEGNRFGIIQMDESAK